MLDQQKLVNQK